MKIKRLLKRIKHSRRKTSAFSLVLIILVFGLTLGYAYVQTTLKVDGTVNVSSANWNVYWDNIVFTPGNVTTVTTPATIFTGKTEVTFSVTFNDPGDYYEFSVDAVNDGTIDAMISNIDGGVYETDGITSKSLPDYLEYSITYDDGVEIGENHLLASGTTETYLVSVHYTEGFDTSQLPTEDDDYVFKFGVNYVQKSRTAVARTKMMQVYNVFSQIGEDGLVPADNSHSNAFDAMLDWEDVSGVSGDKRPYYLKYQLAPELVSYWSEVSTDGEDSCSLDKAYCFDSESDCLNNLSSFATDNGNGTYTSGKYTYFCKKRSYYRVKQSYVEFVISEEMATENEGLTAGIYSLRGGDYGLSYSKNKAILQSAFSSSNCSNITTESATFYECNVGHFNVDAYDDGSIYAYVDNTCGDSANYLSWSQSPSLKAVFLDSKKRDVSLLTILSNCGCMIHYAGSSYCGAV